MTHPTWQLNVDSGALILTPCPGTQNIPLAESLAQLKQQGVTAIVTAISAHEMAEKGVEELGEQTQALGMDWFHLVIEDDCAPDEQFISQWNSASPALHEKIDRGEKVAMHCMGGSGRTGILAAHLLLERQWDISHIIEQVKALRPGAFTKSVQVDYIHRFA
ncbi:phosphatase [Vibrio sinensis]|uniref:Phosphatase n=1 Tax=Vibrio sinensis TaxID=2302434 RepID=A0A3A6QGQ1_9VIBR|nr:cyclin-dependent kinase inhibitor 3 family protein [Vibrio sinensis]RJX65282.1 phosphatase [Vibrio sinensis]